MRRGRERMAGPPVCRNERRLVMVHDRNGADQNIKACEKYARRLGLLALGWHDVVSGDTGGY